MAESSIVPFATGHRRESALAVIERLRAGERLAPADLVFRGAPLSGVDMSGLDLSGADFANADLSGARLTEARLVRATLVGASLVGAEMEGAELTGADLTGAIAEDANLRRAGLGAAALRDARLFSARLEQTTLTQADLTGADLRCARLHRARLREADLSGADLTSAHLTHVDLSSSRVEGATFNNADLRESRLRNVQGFRRADWIGVDLRDINFAGAYRLRRHIVDENYLFELRRSSRLNAALYHAWKLTSDCGRSVGRWFGWIALLVVAFAGAYAALGVDFGEGATWLTPFYFSVVTLTTLGYGDIAPTTPLTQAAAMAQVTLGYVLLGGLLSILANKMARRGE